MSNPIAEYTVSDYSAVDAQIEQINERERVLTKKLKIANLKQLLIVGGIGLAALGVFLLLAGIAYRIAFPPTIEVVNKAKDINLNLTSEPQKIDLRIRAGNVIDDAFQQMLELVKGNFNWITTRL